MGYTNLSGQVRVGVRPAVTAEQLQTATYLLNSYGGAAAAYSLRKLNSTYGGSAVRVRRSVDTVEVNIGFDGSGNLDTTGLLSFVNLSDTSSTSKLLDQYSGSSAAYSLRKLSDTYSGSAIRVRRSSDNQEMNIGFDSGGNLDTTGLLSFVGSGNGSVTTWYDQSGLGKNAVQTSASNQPWVVYNGVLQTYNGKPTIFFNSGYSHYFDCGYLNGGTKPLNYSSWVLARYSFSSYQVSSIIQSGNNAGEGRTAYNLIGMWSNGKMFGNSGDGTNYRYWTGQTPITLITQRYLFEGHYKSNTSPYLGQIWLNGNSEVISDFAGGNAQQSSGPEFKTTIGRSGEYNGGYFQGDLQEIVMYFTDKTSVRSSISSNINSYYSVYTPTSNGFVTTWYDQSGNGRNVTQTTSSNQPQIVSNGSILLRNGKPAIDFTSGQTLRAESRIIGVDSTSIFNVFSVKSLTNRSVPWDIGLNTPYTYYAFDVNTWQTAGQRFGFYTSAHALDTNLSTNLSQNILSIISNNSQGSTISTNTNYHINNKLGTLPANNAIYGNFTSASRITFGTFNGTYAVGFDGTHQEFIAYQTNKLTDRTSITNDMNGYYSIWDGSIVQSGLVMNLDASFKSSYLGTGSTWTDISYNGNNGTLTNGVGYSSTNGGVMTFDGVNDYVQMSNALTLGTNQFTIEFWINNKYNYTSGNFKNTILSNYLDYNSSWNTYLYIGIYYGTNGGDFGSFNSNGDIYLINSIGNFIMNPSNTGKINITNNQWTHVCFVRNGNDVSTYKNGVKLATINNVSTANNNYSGSRSFRIGGGVSGSQNHFGDLSNNRIYNTALTDAEVLQNFNASKSRFGL